MFSFFEIGISDRRKKSIPGNSLTSTVQHVYFKARIRGLEALIPPSRDGCRRELRGRRTVWAAERNRPGAGFLTVAFGVPAFRSSQLMGYLDPRSATLTDRLGPA